MSETTKTDQSSSKKIYGDPPKINISLPEINELTQNSKRWKDVQLPIDILLLTVKDCEFLSCYYYIAGPFRSYFKGIGHVYFGSIGGDQDVKLKVALMKCSEGSKVPGGALTVVKNAVSQLRPKAVFSVGHCSGMNQESTKLGDVVVSEKLTTYSCQKVRKDGKKFSGFTTPVSRNTAELIKCAGDGWNPPLQNPEKRKVELHCGEVLSGSEPLQAEWRRDDLVKSFPEAIAIETEGEEIFSAAHDLKMEWVAVKGISGYADGTETKENWQTFASVTAASLVVSILNQCSIFEDWPHYKGGSTKHLGWPKVKRRDEESSPSDALTPKKRKTRLAGGSTKHLRWPKVKRRDEESSPSDTLISKKRKSRSAGGSTKHSRWPKVKRRDEESSPSDALTPKKRKTRLPGRSTQHLRRLKVKRRDEESSLSDPLTLKKGKTCLAGGSTKHLPRPEVKRRKEESSSNDALTLKKGKTCLAVKQRVPSDKDLERLSQKLDKWKTVGRRLEIEEARLTAFDNENSEWSEKIYKMLLHWKERNGSAATYMVLHDALCHPLVNRKDLAEQFITGDSTKHLRRPKVKRHDEESSPNDALTPKKGKTRVAGGSTKHSPRPKVKGRDEESSPSDASIPKERGGSTKHLPPPKVKRRNEESSPSDALTPKKIDSSVTEFWEWCRNQLRAFYNTMCQVKITPWDPDNTVHINSIYVQVTFLQDHRKPDGTTKKQLGDSSEVFEGDEDHPIRRRILVYGRPGIGKSTFTQKVAVDWTNGRKKILEKFNLLLLIRLRDVCGISDLCTMLKTAELLSADDPMAVNNLCEYVRQNQEKVLLILDGYDEYSGGKSSLIHQIWRGSQLRDCCVMITTRPVKEDELRVPSHAQFELNGFDSLEQKEQFARKILPDEEDVEGLLEYLRKHDLMKMAEIPLLLLMLCLLWKKKKPQLPTSRGEIYVEFIQTLLDHMAIKDSDNVATDKSIDEYQEELSKIGKLAFDALLEDCLHFNFSKFPPGDLFEKLIHVGFFQVSKLSALNREKIVSFLHKSVQEFLAAWFIVQEAKFKKNETVTFLSGMDTFEKSRKMAEVLKFVRELSSEAAGIVFDHLRYVGEKEGLTDYNFTRTPSVKDLSHAQKEFILFCVDHLFRCPASDRLAVYSAFLSCVNHVVILDEEHLSTAAKTHFFKDTTSFPNYLFYSGWKSNLFYSSWKSNLFYSYRESNYDDFLSILFDLNAVLLTCSGEIKDVNEYADLREADFFLKKSEMRNFIYLRRITKTVLRSKLFHELILVPVCSSQPPVDNLRNNEDDNIALSLTENRSDQTQQHCLSLVREVQLDPVKVEDIVLLKNLLPLLTAPRDIVIWGSVIDALEGNSIESAIHRINFTDNLHSLELRVINLTAKCAAFIAESLHHSPNLHELCLSFNPLHSGVSHLAKNLHHVQQLTKLQLQDVQMGERECAALAASLQYLNKLEELDMSSNAVGHGIIELAKNLNSVPNLTKLNLSSTNMGEDEASALARALKDVPELSNLSLALNPLGRGFRDLVQHLSSVPKLRCLSLSSFQMTKTEIEELYTAVKGRGITLFTDYHKNEMKGGEWINRLLTEAELKKEGIRFRKEPDDDDDNDE